MRYIVGAGLFFAFLFTHSSAEAICGDVTGDGKRGATDALAVLRAATGQPIELTCAGEGPSALRYYNDFSCGGGDATSQAQFNGLTFNAVSGDFSEYQTVDRESIDTIIITICGSDFNFPGPIYLAPDRAISFYVALLDPGVYGDGRALFVLYDDGTTASEATLSAGAAPSSVIGTAVGERVTR